MAKKKINGDRKAGASDGTVTAVLKIEMHCEGCAGKIVKSVNSLNGVESVERRNNNLNEIAVIGKFDPVELCESVKGKFKRKVELISPVIKTKNGGGSGGDGEKNTAVVKDESILKKLAVTTTVLKVPLHCRGCIEKIEKMVRKTEGFVEMSIDKSNDLVTVKGAMDMNALALAIKDKLKKEVEIVQAKGAGGGKKGKGGVGGGDSGDDNKEGKGKAKESGGVGPTVTEYNQRMEYFASQGQYVYPQYVNRPEYTFNYMHATQMFNDENANACVVM